MNLRFISNAVGAAKLALKAKAPTLLVVGGVTSMGVGTVLACRQTLKIEEVLQPHVEMLNRIEEGTRLQLDSYDTEVAAGDRYKVYARVAFDASKVYAIPGALWLSGAGMVFGGHHLMIKRNATLAMAFTGLKGLFDKYRDNVRNEFGPQVDQAMLTGHTFEKIVDPETGAEVLVPVRDWDEASKDPYNRVFEQGASEMWQPDLGVNKMFVAQQQRFAQELLNRRGYLWLSEVYQALGFPESDISRVVGWKVKKNPDGSKDFPVVDFGLDTPLPDDWKYNREKAIFLDFNCQGLIVGGKVQKILERA